LDIYLIIDGVLSIDFKNGINKYPTKISRQDMFGNLKCLYKYE